MLKLIECFPVLEGTQKVMRIGGTTPNRSSHGVVCWLLYGKLHLSTPGLTYMLKAVSAAANTWVWKRKCSTPVPRPHPPLACPT